jgi:hypothetical protein
MISSTNKRPFGLIVIIGLQLLNFAIALVTAFYLFGGTLPRWPDLANDGYHMLAALVVLIDMWGLAIIYGLWRYKHWAWPMLMVQTGTNLLITLVNYFEGRPHYLDMLIGVLIVFYLNQDEIRQRFLEPELESEAEP